MKTTEELLKEIDELKHKNQVLKELNQKEISEHLQSDLLANESELYLNSLINNRNESIWSIDNNYNLVVFNDFFKKAYFATFGIELKKGLNGLDILTPENLAFWKPKYSKALSGEKVIFEFSTKIEDDDYFHEITLSPTIIDDNIIGASGISKDITDRKIAEKVSLENKANMVAIIENTTDSIWAIDTSYKILYVNAVFAKAFKTSFGVHIKAGVNLLLALPEKLRLTWKYRYDRAFNNERFSFIDKIKLENSTLYIEVFFNPIIIDDKVVGASLFGRDITERKKAEEDIKHHIEQLQIVNKNKDRFFSIISHDLRSPFLALMGISQTISEDMDSMSADEIKEMTRIIYNSTSNLHKLIENLLDWSLLQMGTFEISPKEIDIKEVSQNTLNTLSLYAKEKNITILNNITETILFADEDCTKTILRNLINNSIKFTQRGGEIKLSSKEEDKFIKITVEDNGVGMTETTLKKLFCINEKISEVGTEKETGTGIGLILCNDFVEKNNGKFWVKSKLGKGSEFTFSLPKMN